MPLAVCLACTYAWLRRLVAPGNSIDPDPKKNRAQYLRYSVDNLADIAGIRFERTADGGYRDKLEYVICVYDLNRELIDVMSNDIAITFTNAQYAALVQSGLPYQQVIRFLLRESTWCALRCMA
jgi:hypothetical protein